MRMADLFKGLTAKDFESAAVRVNVKCSDGTVKARLADTFIPDLNLTGVENAIDKGATVSYTRKGADGSKLGDGGTFKKEAKAKAKSFLRGLIQADDDSGEESAPETPRRNRNRQTAEANGQAEVTEVGASA